MNNLRRCKNHENLQPPLKINTGSICCLADSHESESSAGSLEWNHDRPDSVRTAAQLYRRSSQTTAGGSRPRSAPSHQYPIRSLSGRDRSLYEGNPRSAPIAIFMAAQRRGDPDSLFRRHAVLEAFHKDMINQSAHPTVRPNSTHCSSASSSDFSQQLLCITRSKMLHIQLSNGSFSVYP